MCLYPVPINIGTEHVKKWIRVPCGKCTECQEQYSNEWAFRAVQEASFHSESCFVTLTYENNPVMLQPDDLTKFLKRLRRRIEPIKIRYFACGEYGSKGLRPHYHLLIFGWKPQDLIPFKKDNRGNQIYLSPFLSEVWHYGFTSVGDITISSAKYCAKYMQKFQELPKNFVRPFTRVSLKPGLGYLSIPVANLNTDTIIVNGQSIRIPRYYLKKLEDDGIDLSILKSNRVAIGQQKQSFLGEQKRLKNSLDFLS